MLLVALLLNKFQSLFVSLDILFQDLYYVAVKKPAGLLVHRTEIDAHETEAALQIVRDQINSKIFPVHRLDRPTSGVLLFAKSSEAASLLSEKFSKKEIEKKYLAIVRGQLRQEILLDYPMVNELGEGDDLQAQEAQTYFKPIATAELPIFIDRYSTSRYSLIEAWPKTGRTHQIRKHLKHLNHPIIGDVNHGNGKHNRYFSEMLQIKRLLLICIEMSFQHPYTQEQIQIKAALCDDFKLAISKLGFSYDA